MVTVYGWARGVTFGRRLTLPAGADRDDLTASAGERVLRLRTRREPALCRPVPIADGRTLIHAEATGG